MYSNMFSNMVENMFRAITGFLTCSITGSLASLVGPIAYLRWARRSTMLPSGRKHSEGVVRSGEKWYKGCNKVGGSGEEVIKSLNL